MITREEILKNYTTGKIQECPENLKDNLEMLLEDINKFRKVYNKPMFVNSGYTNEEYAEKIGRSKNSAHCQCLAIDFSDADGEIRNFILKDISILRRYNLYMEHPRYTKLWCHLGIRPPRSNSLIFVPYIGEPKEKDLDIRFEMIKYNEKHQNPRLFI